MVALQVLREQHGYLTTCRTLAVVLLAAGWILPHGDAVLADEPAGLDQQLTDYRAYGLPLPPEEAQLIKRRHTAGIVNGVQQYRFDLAFRSRDGGKDTHWVGCLRTKPAGEVEAIAHPKADLLQGAPWASSDRRDGFDLNADLALAIQCHARGWSDLSAALIARSKQPSDDPFSQRRPRPRDDRAALAHTAWNYWCHAFSRTQGDRLPIVERLKQLRDTPFGLATAAHQNLIADMEQTLARRDPPGDRLAAALESLIDLGLDEHSCGNFTYSAPRHKGYETLQAAGLEAAPLLIRHLDDFRLTRCIQTSSRGVWHARIADVVARLLNELAVEQFAYDFLIKEGRGIRLDQAHVMSWWSEAQGTKALEYMRKNAVAADEHDELRANESLLLSLGQRYPDELVKLFYAHYEKLEQPDPLFTALGRSKAPNETKFAALMQAAKNRESRLRIEALEQLQVLHHPQTSELIVAELKALPKTPERPYWLCDAPRFAWLAARADQQVTWQALAETARRVDLGQRLEMMDTVSDLRPPSRQAVEFLAGFLDDEMVRVIERAGFPEPGKPEPLFSGPCAGFTFERLAVRDFAALSLAPLVKVDVDPDSNWKEDDWSRLRQQVRKALATSGAGDNAGERMP
jgi:hypothetical protein